MCKVLQILFISLAKPKPVRGFDGRPASDITHAIYFMLTVQSYSELLTPMLVTKLDQHLLILGKPWMQKHGLIIDISCNKITFWPSYCQHLMAEAESQGIVLAPSQSKPMRGQKEVLVWEIERIVSCFSFKGNNKKIPAGQDIPHTNSGVYKSKEGITPRRKILKKEPDTKTKQKETASTKKLLELLLYMLPSAHRYQCVSKQAERLLSKYIVPQRWVKALLLASSLTSLSAMSKASRLEEEPLQLVMIGAVLFQYLVKQKNVQIFTISMRDINHQLDKDKRPPTNLATRVPKCYYNFLNIFLKKASNTISVYLKHNSVIRLLSENDHGQAALRPMSNERLIFVKKFLKDNLKKGFIEASSAPCSLSIMLAVKPRSGIHFCVDYQKLNELTKKDAYSIPLIAKTLA